MYALWVAADQRYAFSPIDNGGVVITADAYLALFQGQAKARPIVAGANGIPVSGDISPLTADDLSANGRSWRDAEIARVAWLRDRQRDELELGGATSITAEQYTELLAYIQGLRDWPLTPDFPVEASRPKMPDWIATLNP